MIKTIEYATKDFLTKAKSKLKESTFSRYSFICERHIVPYFQGVQLNQLSNQDITDFIQYKLKNGGLRGTPLSPKTINDMVCLLAQIIKNYSKFDIDIEKPQYIQEEISIFTEAEYSKLKSYLSIGTDSKKLGIIIAMLTGLRVGELCALKWENIDLERGTIFINKTIQRIKNTDRTARAKTKVIIDTPKSKTSIRTIPIQGILLSKLAQFQANSGSYVLTNTKKYIEPRVYQRHFKAYLGACAIREYNFHVLRHTFATTAISNGTELKALSMILGHSDVGFTMQCYVHPNLEHRRIQIEKVAIGF
ncbi:MAG: site-specific integrase [Defluviitaleaceae bacterium]|nr:site-specific integrase [Defluviitaleaceae bacterium]